MKHSRKLTSALPSSIFLAHFFIRAYFSDQFGDISLSSFSSFLRKNDITDTEENNSGFLRRLFLEEEEEDVKEIFDAKSERFYAPFGGYICYFSLSRNIMATSLFQKMMANNISLEIHSIQKTQNKSPSNLLATCIFTYFLGNNKFV